jgi:hypothetical protein
VCNKFFDAQAEYSSLEDDAEITGTGTGSDERLDRLGNILETMHQYGVAENAQRKL